MIPEQFSPTDTRTRTLMKRRPLWKRLFFDNVWLKLTSLIITLVLFFIVREDKGKEVDIEVPIVLAHVSEKDVFVGEIPHSIRVRVRDRWSRLARALERKPNPYLVDLRGFLNETVFVFDKDRIRQLIGVSSLSVQSIYPSDFVVRLEPKTERVVPIRPNLVGEPQEGYEIPRDSIKCSPDMLKIWGAKSSVTKVTELLTHPIDLAKFERDSRVEVPIQQPNLPYLYLEDDKTSVDLRVIARKGRLTLDNPVEVAVKNCPEDRICQIDPPTVSVTLVGPKPTLLKIKDKSVPMEIYVDATDYDANITRHDTVRPNCDRPVGVECSMKPKTVTLFITNEDNSKGPHKGK